MPLAALQSAKQALNVPLGSVSWELKVGIDFRSLLASATVPFTALSAAAQAQAQERGYAEGEAVSLMFSGKLGTEPGFDIVNKGEIPGLGWVARTDPPRSLLSRGRKRALRTALADDSVSNGAKEWALAEIEGGREPELAWVLASDKPHVIENEYGTVIVTSQSWSGGRLGHTRDLVETTAGPEAAALLRDTLHDGESADVVRHDKRQITYVGFRLEPGEGPTSRVEKFLVGMHEMWPSPAEIEAAERAAKEVAAAAPPEMCWFCKRNEAGKSHAVPVVLYAPETVERSSHQVGAQVQKTVRYMQTTVKVPRCQSCQEVHVAVSNRAFAGGAVGFFAGLALSVAAYFLIGRWELAGFARILAWVGMVLLPAVGAIWGGVRGEVGGNARLPVGVAPLESKKDYRVVAELHEEGYQFGAPSP